MRIDDLEFEYDEELYSLVSGIDDIDIMIQPVDSGFIAQVVDGTTVHRLGKFVSERWAKVCGLNKAQEILKDRVVAPSVDRVGGASELSAPVPMTREQERYAILWALDMLPSFVVWSEAKDRAPSGDVIRPDLDSSPYGTV